MRTPRFKRGCFCREIVLGMWKQPPDFWGDIWSANCCRGKSPAPQSFGPSMPGCPIGALGGVRLPPSAVYKPKTSAATNWCLHPFPMGTKEKAPQERLNDCLGSQAEASKKRGKKQRRREDEAASKLEAKKCSPVDWPSKLQILSGGVAATSARARQSP